MKALLLSLLLTLLAFNGFGQKSLSKAPVLKPGQPVTLTWAQVVKTVRYSDSLKLAATRARQQLRVQALATIAYRNSADSFRVALQSKEWEADHLKQVLASTNVLLVSQTAKTAKYRARAHRKGWVNLVLSAAVAGLLYGVITK